MGFGTCECFNKKKVTSMKTGSPIDYYFIAIRDSLGYSADQIVNKSVYDSMNQIPCDVEYTIDCSSGKVRLQFRKKA